MRSGAAFAAIPAMRYASRSIAATAVLAGVLVMPAACSDVEISCAPPTFQVEAEPQDVAEHCALAVAAECRRAFADCPDLGTYKDEFSDVELCVLQAPSAHCDAASVSDAYLVDDNSEACLAALPEVSCAELQQEGGAKACWDVMRPVPPDPSSCHVVGAGAHEGSFDTAVNKAWGGFASLHCVCLEKGDPITIHVGRAGLDNPVINLFSPTGDVVASASNGGPMHTTAKATGSYLVLVSERDGGKKGQPVTVTIELEED